MEDNKTVDRFTRKQLRVLESRLADLKAKSHEIAQRIKEAREQVGLKPLRTQGMENNFWIILDYGHIVIHIFLEEYRQFYRLEDLWADAPRKSWKLRTKPSITKDDVTTE